MQIYPVNIPVSFRACIVTGNIMRFTCYVKFLLQNTCTLRSNTHRVQWERTGTIDRSTRDKSNCVCHEELTQRHKHKLFLASQRHISSYGAGVREAPAHFQWEGAVFWTLFINYGGDECVLTFMVDIWLLQSYLRWRRQNRNSNNGWFILQIF